MPRRTEWFTPRRSGNGGNCVETYLGADFVQVRDSKARRAGTVTFTHDEWRAFVEGLRDPTGRRTR